MIVEMWAPGGKSPAVVSVSRILVRDGNGNPIAFAAQFMDNGSGGQCCMAATPDDPMWKSILETVGAKPAEITHHIDIGSG